MSEPAKTLEASADARHVKPEESADTEALTRAPANANQLEPALSDANLLRTELATLELLRGTGPELLDAVIARCPLRVLEPEATLLATGQTNAELFLILRGELNVFLEGDRNVPVAKLRAGDTVGELSVIDKKPTSANVIAATQTVVMCVDENMFWHIVHASHGFAVRLMLKLAERLRANNTTVQVNRELCAHFEQVALSDALTGVHSRRWLDDTLPRLCERHRFEALPLSVAVVDVDHFKRINDEYGHQTGDLVLSEIAKTMRQRLRPTDFVARYGGEEFVLLFPRTPLAGACIAAERQREAVRAAVLKTRDGVQIPHATVSIGVAELLPGQDGTRLVQTADSALYRAKHNGRNRVES